MEAPERRDLAWVGHDHLNEAPEKKSNQNMENYQNGPCISAVGCDGYGPPSLNSETVVLEDDDQYCEEHEEVAKDLGLSEG